MLGSLGTFSSKTTEAYFDLLSSIYWCIFHLNLFGALVAPRVKPFCWMETKQ